MPCAPDELKHVPLFALLDQEEIAVLAAQVELKTFAPRQRIYKMGDPGMHAYILMSGSVQVSTVDEDHQEVVVDQPGHGQFFGFASMLEQTPHQTSALAMEKTQCVEISRDDIAILLQRKPMAGMDMLTVLGQQFHASQQLVRLRASRNANEVIEEKSTFGERIADDRPHATPWVERAVRILKDHLHAAAKGLHLPPRSVRDCGEVRPQRSGNSQSERRTSRLCGRAPQCAAMRYLMALSNVHVGNGRFPSFWG